MPSPSEEDNSHASDVAEHCASRQQTADRLQNLFFAPVDASFLAFFRIMFGSMMLWQVWHFSGWTWFEGWFHYADELYLKPDFHSTYYGFGWVKPWPKIGEHLHGLHLHFAALGVASVLVIVGLFYRFACVLLCLGFTYVFLLDMAAYNNHYYLLCLVAMVMSFMPAECLFSVDSRRKPALRSKTVPAWTLWLLRAHIAIPYFYGGISKINADWLRGEPIRTWFYGGSHSDLPFLQTETAVTLASYGGLLFDLLVVPMLLWRRTRIIAFLAAAVFHLCNAHLFRIGVFPWFMLLGTTIFFSPDWPRRAFAWAIRVKIPFFDRVSALLSRRKSSQQHDYVEHDFNSRFSPRQRRRTILVIFAYLAFQLLWPFRHFFYSGTTAWTGRGDWFAWRMMLNNKETTELKFFTTTPNAPKTAEGRPQLSEVPARYINKSLSRLQVKHMVRNPDLLLQYCHFLSDKLRSHEGEKAEIYVRVKVSLNSRQPQLLIDPDVNLAAVPRTLIGPNNWIMPFENTPLIRPDAKKIRR